MAVAARKQKRAKRSSHLSQEERPPCKPVLHLLHCRAKPVLWPGIHLEGTPKALAPGLAGPAIRSTKPGGAGLNTGSVEIAKRCNVRSVMPLGSDTNARGLMALVNAGLGAMENVSSGVIWVMSGGVGVIAPVED